MTNTSTPEGLRALLAEIGVEVTSTSFAGADISNCPLDVYVSYVADVLVQATGCEPQVAYEAILSDDLCDLVAVMPKLRMKDMKPTDTALEVLKKFPNNPLFGQPFRDGINLRLIFSSDALARMLLPYIIDRGSSYGKYLISPPGKIIVEHSRPQLGKELDGNNIRSTIIGAFISAIYQSQGSYVVRLNYLGDWGKNMGLLAVAWSRFGSEELLETQPLSHLVDIYQQIEELYKPEQEAAKKARADGDSATAIDIETKGIAVEKDEFFKKMEDGDPEALALWKRFRETYIVRLIELYGRLKINFDEYSGESQVGQEAILRVEVMLNEKGIYEDSGEAWIIDFKKHGHKGLGAAILRYRNGTTSYLMRDIAAVLERYKKYAFDRMIYVVSAKQDSHFQQLFEALKLMGRSGIANKLQHISFGKVQSTSQGLLESMLDQCQTTIQALLDADPDDTKELQGANSEALQALSATALMVQDLSIKRSGSFILDPSNIAVTDGHTGINLQQWYNRISHKLSGTTVPRSELQGANYSIFDQDEYTDILRVLIQFPSIVKATFKTLESATILAYLFRLTDLLPAAWEADDVEEKGGGSNRNMAELAFWECVRLVLGNGMEMVGLTLLKI